MADIHLLDRVSPNHFRVAFHYPAPGGTSPAGIAWSSAFITRHRISNGGALPASQLPIGDGTGGTITQQEADAIGAGTVIEEVLTRAIKSGGDSIAEVRSTVREQYDRARTALFDRLQDELDQFGRTDSAA